MPPPPLDCFAITPPGVEAWTAAELSALGITPGAVTHGGVSWGGTLDDVLRANLWLRTASRVVVRVATFGAKTFFELERKAKRVPWTDYVMPGREVRFRVTCRKSRLYHSDAVAQRLAAAVAPCSSHVTAGASDDEEDGGDTQLFVVRVDHDRVQISADASGALLHRRGYRRAVAKAPLRETVAAAMLLASGWDHRAPLIDPMCGSGTIPIEGALLARNVAPGLLRDFSFLRWPTVDTLAWTRLTDRAREEALPRAPGRILAADRDAGAVEATLANAERAGVTKDLEVTVRALSATEPVEVPERLPGWIVTNPPYGVRVGDADVRNLYAQFGKLVHDRFSGWRIGVLSADVALERQMRLRFEQSFKTSNGGIPVRFVTAGVP